jgi:hypothetical protein
MQMKLRCLLVLFGFMVASDYAFAWAHEGHEVIGSIADHLINRHAKSKIAQILGFELRVAATWAHCVKSVKRHDDGTFVFGPPVRSQHEDGWWQSD